MLVHVHQPEHVGTAKGEGKVLDRPRHREARVRVLVLGLEVVHGGGGRVAPGGGSTPHAVALLCRTAGGCGSLPIDPFTRQRPCHLSQRPKPLPSLLSPDHPHSTSDSRGFSAPLVWSWGSAAVWSELGEHPPPPRRGLTARCRWCGWEEESPSQPPVSKYREEGCCPPPPSPPTAHSARHTRSTPTPCHSPSDQPESHVFTHIIFSYMCVCVFACCFFTSAIMRPSTQSYLQLKLSYVLGCDFDGY